jgi:hypothetical protein
MYSLPLCAGRTVPLLKLRVGFCNDFSFTLFRFNANLCRQDTYEAILDTVRSCYPLSLFH